MKFDRGVLGKYESLFVILVGRRFSRGLLVKLEVRIFGKIEWGILRVYSGFVLDDFVVKLMFYVVKIQNKNTEYF